MHPIYLPITCGFQKLRILCIKHVDKVRTFLTCMDCRSSAGLCLHTRDERSRTVRLCRLARQRSSL